jgi:hypothetical protein
MTIRFSTLSVPVHHLPLALAVRTASMLAALFARGRGFIGSACNTVHGAPLGICGLLTRAPHVEWVVLTLLTGLALPKLVAGADWRELRLARPGEAGSSVVAAQRASRDVDESGHALHAASCQASVASSFSPPRWDLAARVARAVQLYARFWGRKTRTIRSERLANPPRICAPCLP